MDMGAQGAQLHFRLDARPAVAEAFFADLALHPRDATGLARAAFQSRNVFSWARPHGFPGPKGVAFCVWRSVPSWATAVATGRAEPSRSMNGRRVFRFDCCDASRCGLFAGLFAESARQECELRELRLRFEMEAREERSHIAVRALGALRGSCGGGPGPPTRRSPAQRRPGAEGARVFLFCFF